jgi:hypothetical protein
MLAHVHGPYKPDTTCNHEQSYYMYYAMHFYNFERVVEWTSYYFEWPPYMGFRKRTAFTVHLCFFYSSGIYIIIHAFLTKAYRQLLADYSLCNAYIIWKRVQSSRPTSYDNNYLSAAAYYYSFVRRLPTHPRY